MPCSALGWAPLLLWLRTALPELRCWWLACNSFSNARLALLDNAISRSCTAPHTLTRVDDDENVDNNANHNKDVAM